MQTVRYQILAIHLNQPKIVDFIQLAEREKQLHSFRLAAQIKIWVQTLPGITNLIWRYLHILHADLVAVLDSCRTAKRVHHHCHSGLVRANARSDTMLITISQNPSGQASTGVAIAVLKLRGSIR